MAARKPSRGDHDRGTRRGEGGGDNGETNLGALLKAALQAQQGQAVVQEPETREEPAKSQEERKLKRCADCWHALVYKDERGRLTARCEKNLWMRPFYSYEELNTDKVRRWHADCPEYDDSE